MIKTKHEEILKEVEEEITSAIEDKRGLLPHQRRLAFSLSLCMANIIELYFHNLDILKEGSKINHLWFKRNKNRIKEKLQNQMIISVDSVKNIDAILDLSIKIEEKRDDLAYGSPSNEKLLQEKINLFLELRRVAKC